MFYYRIYGLIVRCNVDMSLLMPVEETEYYDMEISVLYNVLPSSSRIKISEHIDFYRVELCSFAEYKIFKEKALIECNASCETDFFSTLFNIPFSVYFMMKDEVLFHTNTVLRNGSLFMFCGEKGVGKSTLTGIINNEKDFELYSDDTIRIDGSGSCFRASDLIKLTVETLNSLIIGKRTGVKNSVGKEFCFIEAGEQECNFRFVFRLHRGADFKIKKINNAAIKKSILIGNIVGVEYFCRSLLEKAISVSDKLSPEYYEMRVPNGLEKLEDCCSDICETLKMIAD